MKLIKKMLAIMFAFMMVVGMGTKVNAEENESTTATTGTIIIGNAVDGQTYSIYKVLELESYDTDNGLYSYKPVDAWKEFFQIADATAGKEKGAGSDFVTIDENGYATWKKDADVKKFAGLALEYAKTKRINNNGQNKATENTVTFENLPLGYYLVDSSVGALCGLNTTNLAVNIQEKNEVPTVDKKILINNDLKQLNDKNSVDIGDTVIFQTTIEVKPGAQNYILHDVMNSHLEFIGIHGVYDNANEVNSSENSKGYAMNDDFVVHNDLKDGCTFELTFTDAFYNKAKDAIDSKKITKIYIQYYARVGVNAPINTAMNNKTWLTFGDNNSTNISETNTYTFGIPVFKYTGINKTPLAGAKFTLYTDESCAAGKALKFKLNNTTNKYRYDASGLEILTSLDNTGRVDIEGIKAGTYYLKEVEAPKGYNKLASAIKVKIDSNGKIYLNGSKDANDGDVKVENKTGTLLPSTGGMGTTMIYMAGAILVIASGIVLVSKKRSKAK